MLSPNEIQQAEANRLALTDNKWCRGCQIYCWKKQIIKVNKAYWYLKKCPDWVFTWKTGILCWAYSYRQGLAAVPARQPGAAYRIILICHGLARSHWLLIEDIIRMLYTLRLGFPIAIPLRITLRNATQFLLPFPQDLLRIFRILLRLICE